MNPSNLEIELEIISCHANEDNRKNKKLGKLSQLQRKLH